MFNSKRRRRERQQQEAKELLMAMQSYSIQPQPSEYWSSGFLVSVQDSGFKGQHQVQLVTAHSDSSSRARITSWMEEISSLLVRARKAEIVGKCDACKQTDLRREQALVAHYNDAHCLPRGFDGSYPGYWMESVEEWWTRALELTL